MLPPQSTAAKPHASSDGSLLMQASGLLRFIDKSCRGMQTVLPAYSFVCGCPPRMFRGNTSKQSSLSPLLLVKWPHTT